VSRTSRCVEYSRRCLMLGSLAAFWVTARLDTIPNFEQLVKTQCDWPTDNVVHVIHKPPQRAPLGKICGMRTVLYRLRDSWNQRRHLPEFQLLGNTDNGSCSSAFFQEAHTHNKNPTCHEFSVFPQRSTREPRC